MFCTTHITSTLSSMGSADDGFFELCNCQCVAFGTEVLFNKTGWISVNDWACAVEAVLQLGVPWRVLRSQLVPNTSDGRIDYQAWFRELAVKEPDTEVSVYVEAEKRTLHLSNNQRITVTVKLTLNHLLTCLSHH